MLCSLPAWSYVKQERSVIVLFEHVTRICVCNLGHGKDGYAVAVVNNLGNKLSSSMLQVKTHSCVFYGHIMWYATASDLCLK
jgi:hypothetical protein